ncbi:hypothetical protein AGR4B_pAt10108 [Agrobacterium tumefaciens str. CFBP 5621]|nr:hypothetical protein AGR4B_pAt10108 [Agrobacterium tumefaciens str. CFBP 5621]
MPTFVDFEVVGIIPPELDLFLTTLSVRFDHSKLFEGNEHGLSVLTKLPRWCHKQGQAPP